MLLQQLDILGLEGWSGANHSSAHALLTEYHDLFSLEPGELGCTSLAKHKIKVVHNEPFKESLKDPPPMVEEVRAHMKEISEVGPIHSSQSPWCNVVALVRKNRPPQIISLTYLYETAITLLTSINKNNNLTIYTQSFEFVC